MLRSMKINLGRHAIANSKASAPSIAEITGQPRIRSVMTRISRQSVLSSTTKIKFLFSVRVPFSNFFSQGRASPPISLCNQSSCTVHDQTRLGAVRVCVAGPPQSPYGLMSRFSPKLRSKKVNRTVNGTYIGLSIFSTRATSAGLPVNFPRGHPLSGGSQGLY
jgi:hypothetical protein